jgi:hypothetical protein
MGWKRDVLAWKWGTRYNASGTLKETIVQKSEKLKTHEHTDSVLIPSERITQSRSNCATKVTSKELRIRGSMHLSIKGLYFPKKHTPMVRGRT